MPVFHAFFSGGTVLGALVAAGVGTVVGVTTTCSAAQLRSAGAQETVADLAPATTLRALGVR